MGLRRSDGVRLNFCFIYHPVERLQSRRLTLYSFQINYSLFPPSPSTLFGCRAARQVTCMSVTQERRRENR